MEKKRIVIIKIGSSVILTERNKPDEFCLSHLTDQILRVREEGLRVILVISGAVAVGANYINITDNHLLRKGAAGIGQVYLISKLYALFRRKNTVIAQILLTRDDLLKKENMYNLLNFYLEKNILPILNENDVVKLNNFGGNDFLAYEVAKLMDAWQLVILSSYEKSKFGVGGGKSKNEVLRKLMDINIKAKIIDGKGKNVILQEVLWK